MSNKQYLDVKEALHLADNAVINIDLDPDKKIVDAMWELLKYTRSVEKRLFDVMSHNRLGDGS